MRATLSVPVLRRVLKDGVHIGPGLLLAPTVPTVCAEERVLEVVFPSSFVSGAVCIFKFLVLVMVVS